MSIGRITTIGAVVDTYKQLIVIFFFFFVVIVVIGQHELTARNVGTFLFRGDHFAGRRGGPTTGVSFGRCEPQ
eukprot:scaffold450_cov175-Amphora_coffeaeformis.AAC.1